VHSPDEAAKERGKAGPLDYLPLVPRQDRHGICENRSKGQETQDLVRRLLGEMALPTPQIGFPEMNLNFLTLRKRSQEVLPEIFHAEEGIGMSATTRMRSWKTARSTVSRNATNLRKLQANIEPETLRKNWPKSSFGQSIAATSGQRVR